MKIIKGKLPHAKKFAVYGPEGIGKSTFASRFPDPVFIDTEGSTKDMNVSRFEKPTSWPMVLEQVRYIHDNPGTCKTLVIDTVDWAEQMCIEHICVKHQKDGLESFGYGSGYIYVKEEFSRFLNRLEEVIECGVNVVLVAHAQLRKFEQPDEMGAYDRWELKLGKKTASQISPLIKEWSDALLFANYKTHVVKVDGKNKAQGGARVMYTAHHSCWDAKNRYGLPEELPFEYGAIAHIISNGTAPQTENAAQAVYAQRSIYTETEAVPEVAEKSIPEPKKEAPSVSGNDVPDINTAQDAVPDGQQMSLPLGMGDGHTGDFTVDQRIPKQLRDLMVMHQVSEWDIENVVTAKGYIPDGVPIWEYETVNPGFLDGVLVAAWDQVYGAIKKMRENEEIPFN
ncbi:MAG TPA: hypothetical protein DF613_06255 [Lachnospiraceae bacterium]|nr:hypothetical protein [Lachnospiraceae bacterium]